MDLSGHIVPTTNETALSDSSVPLQNTSHLTSGVAIIPSLPNPNTIVAPTSFVPAVISPSLPLTGPFSQSPAQQFVQSPAHQFTQSPLHQFSQSPVQQFTNSPLHQFVQSPAQQFVRSPPVQQFSQSPVGQFSQSGVPQFNAQFNQSHASIRDNVPGLGNVHSNLVVPASALIAQAQVFQPAKVEASDNGSSLATQPSAPPPAFLTTDVKAPLMGDSQLPHIPTSAMQQPPYSAATEAASFQMETSSSGPDMAPTIMSSVSSSTLVTAHNTPAVAQIKTETAVPNEAPNLMQVETTSTEAAAVPPVDENKLQISDQDLDKSALDAKIMPSPSHAVLDNNPVTHDVRSSRSRTNANNSDRESSPAALAVTGTASRSRSSSQSSKSSKTSSPSAAAAPSGKSSPASVPSPSMGGKRQKKRRPPPTREDQVHIIIICMIFKNETRFHRFL